MDVVETARQEIRIFERPSKQTCERLITEVEQLRDKVNDAKNCLVCAAIADPAEVAESTLAILDA